ncbi:MAG: MFS transporter [Chloroflexota bacterium]|nr:MAG: MFS transporter [Chloroflexota bacterium]
MNQNQGYRPVLRNLNFLKLWFAQILSLMGLQSLLLLSVILIEDVTKSGIQTAGAIVAFSLPAVIFGPIAGVFLDRVSKKTILVVSSAARVASQAVLALLAYLGINRGIDPLLFVGLVYVTIFITSAIGQFFSPAEGATIPLLVKREELFAANSLFTLTIVAIQVVALIVYVPISVKSFGIFGAFVSLVVFYLLATLLLLFLPKDQAAHRVALDGESAVRRGWREIGEGWRFSLDHKVVLTAILQFSLVFTIVSVLGELAPGYANRVLGLATEDAVFVFAPAGIGIVLASLFVVRFGQNLPRYVLPIVGMFTIALGLLGLGLLGMHGERALNTQFQILGITLNATFLVGIAAPLLGVGIALVLIPAQTAIQEGATDVIRGRVLTVQLTLANALSIPLLIAVGGLSDVFGISEIIIALGAMVIPLTLFNWVYARRLPPQSATTPLHSQPIPLAGETTSMVEDTNERAHVGEKLNA